MRARALYFGVLLGAVTLAACSAPDDECEEGACPGLDAAYQDLDALVGTCSFVQGVVSVTSTAAQTIVVGKRAVDSVILVNGADCRTVATPLVAATAATATTMKRLVIKGSSADEAVILDFQGGYFAPGVSSASSGGIAIDLGSGTDSVSLQGSSGADNIFVGADGIAFNGDNYKDITWANVDTLSFALGAGADKLTATNTGVVKGVTGVAAIPLAVFGGEGNDTIVGGKMADTIFGGPGNDTLSGGAGTDDLYGDVGADIIQGGAAADGDDNIDCGDESPTDTSIDIVSYNLREQAITAVMGAPGTAGESNETDSINANCEGITGGLGDDSLTGDANDNVLSGGPGNDMLIGKDGKDTLNGGAGNDTFDEEASPTGADVFIGGAGIDVVDYGDRTTALTVTMDGSAANDGATNEQDDVKADVENIVCGSGNDDITGNALANKITGGDGDDKLNGAAGNDVFVEGAAANGSDTFTGGAGIDLVDYGDRTDALTVTMNDDAANDGDVTASEHDNIKSDVENLIAGDGADDITGNDGNNNIEGGLGNDTIRGGAGDDQLDGSDTGSTNNITCGPGADIALNAGTGSYAFDCELKGH